MVNAIKMMYSLIAEYQLGYSLDIVTCAHLHPKDTASRTILGEHFGSGLQTMLQYLFDALFQH